MSWMHNCCWQYLFHIQFHSLSLVWYICLSVRASCCTGDLSHPRYTLSYVLASFSCLLFLRWKCLSHVACTSVHSRADRLLGVMVDSASCVCFSFGCHDIIYDEHSLVALSCAPLTREKYDRQHCTYPFQRKTVDPSQACVSNEVHESWSALAA